MPSGEEDADSGIIAGKPRPMKISTDESISCYGTMPNESRLREIRTGGLMMRGWRKPLLYSNGMGGLCSD